MHATLIVPAPLSTMSGGHAYDRRIVAAMRAAGHTIDLREADAADPLAALRANSAPEGAVPVIDGLALPAFAACADALAQRRAVALIHHPAAPESGPAATERATRLALGQRLLPCFARIIATSEATAASLVADFAVARERIAVVVPGTDDAPRAAGSGGPGCHVLTVGALVRRKGHDLLLRALARLFDLDWRLTIVGTPTRDPVHARALAALADELGIAAKVAFAGEVDDAALDALWLRADVFALATHWEGYGAAVAEALRRGVPVVVTQGGAAGALVTLESGMVCSPGDQDQLSKSLRRIIFGAALRRDMADAAWRVGRTLPDWHAQARAFVAALDFAATPHDDMLSGAAED
jgi:glycosyltransferase involved in cell wall biosynthesis